MPGDVSMAYPGMPICECQHFKTVHDHNGHCMADNCKCRKFTEIDFDDSELGRAINEWLGIEAYHYGDPCVFCGQRHDDIEPGPCPGRPPNTAST